MLAEDVAASFSHPVRPTSASPNGSEYLFGYHKRRTSRTRQQGVRLGIVSEPFLCRIDLQVPAQAVLRLLEREAVALEVLGHASEGFVGSLVRTEGLCLPAEYDLLAQPVRDIAQVNQRR